MFERLREKSGYIDETICALGDEIKEAHNLEEPAGFGANPVNEPFPTLGRIFCDSEGRLNANSLLLQGTQDLSRGRALPLELSQVRIIFHFFDGAKLQFFVLFFLNLLK